MSQSRKKRKSVQRSSPPKSNTSDSEEVMRQLDKLRTTTRKEQKIISTRPNTNIRVIAFVVILVVGMSGIVILSQFNFSGQNTNTNQSIPGTDIINSLGNFKEDRAATPHFIGNKVSIIFISGEYCPYCAIERWAIVMALSQFGTFSNLQTFTCSEYDIPTYTFIGSSYTSEHIEFLPVEIADNNNKPLQSMTTLQSDLFYKYNSGGSIPFLVIGGSVFQVGSGSPLQLASFSYENINTIQTQISTKSGILYNQINSESGIITTLINQLLSLRPSSTIS